MDINTKREFILQWHITHRCNLRCRHCYQNDYAAFTSRQEMESVLEQFDELLSACGFRGHINITGGEPMLHPELFWLLQQAKRRSVSTAVLTNGTLIGLREARMLKASGVSYVQVSLDGTRKTHDMIRGEGSFEQAAEGIIALRSQGIFTSVSFTAQKNNLRRLKKLAEVCNQLGADMLWFDRVIIPAEEDIHGLALSTAEYKRLCKTAARLSKNGIVTCGRALQFIPCREKHIYKCTAGDTLLALLADGTVMPCRRLPLIAGNINDKSLLNIYRESPVLQELRAHKIPDGCKACKYKEMCRGGSKCAAYAKTGRYDTADPDCCRLSRERDARPGPRFVTSYNSFLQFPAL